MSYPSHHSCVETRSAHNARYLKSEVITLGICRTIYIIYIWIICRLVDLFLDCEASNYIAWDNSNKSLLQCPNSSVYWQALSSTIVILEMDCSGLTFHLRFHPSRPLLHLSALSRWATFFGTPPQLVQNIPHSHHVPHYTRGLPT